MSVDIDERVDVVVSLGTQPIQTAQFTSAAFLADLTDVAFPDAYKVYSNLTQVAADFLSTTKTYKAAAKAFGGKFKVAKFYVVKYRTAGTVLTAVEALNALLAVDATPFWIATDSRVEATVLGLAATCQANHKIFLTSSQSADVLVPATATDIGSLLQDAAYDYAITLYSGSSDAEISEMGIAGAMAGLTAGTSTLEDKTLTGVVADAITTTGRTACEAKNVAYYTSIAGFNSVFNSKVASGQFLDTILFQAWLRARIGEAVYGLIKRESDSGRKVSLDNAGTSKVRSAIYNDVIQVGLNNGSISPDITPVVRTPSREEVSEADRANRVLPDVVVEVLYSNAIHKVLVRAYVSV